MFPEVPRRFLQPAGRPLQVAICAPATCSEEAVGRFVAPRFALEDFPEVDALAWPHYGQEVPGSSRPQEPSQSDVFFMMCTSIKGDFHEVHFRRVWLQ